ncbi:MAG: 3-methyl-2-oxobutanoate hydroxymethyltransferase [Myxococcota bacterium]|nr:3-methyl-2-oxobutanoate hydroxymethyltransferase [Myxococcota bacterium]
MPHSRISTTSLRHKKSRGERITMLTCYDATFAKLMRSTGVDVLLVGDSLGMVIQGEDTTVPVTLDDMVYHCRAVVRGRGDGQAHVVCDLPFMSYHLSPEQALQSAGRMLQDGRAESVKLEGGTEIAPTIKRLTSSGIPVMGHIGLTPQSIHQLGGWKVQGRSEHAADKLLTDALALEEAGAYAVVLETIPASLASKITNALSIPTIGIGAGANCDGQVLVLYDVLGMSPDFNPKFVKRYANLAQHIQTACSEYCRDVRSGEFPSDEHSH